MEIVDTAADLLPILPSNDMVIDFDNINCYTGQLLYLNDISNNKNILNVFL
jgi:hypothetical protein